jgi:cytoskeletal protein CcmA (bactofilin family)
MSFWNKIDKPADVPSSTPSRPSTPYTQVTQPIVAPPPPAPVSAPAARPEPPAPVVAREAPAAAPPRAEGLRLGRGVRFEGKLTFSGTVHLDATFQGSIVTDGVLVVGEAAKIDADITCGSVIIEGEVNGNVTARESVELRRTATLRGEVETPSLAVERGATFEGASRRPGARASASPGKAAAAPAASAH